MNTVETYSRSENNRTLIWNVSRLIGLVEGLPIREVPVARIKELDSEMWFGGPHRVRPTCREVASHVKRIQNADLKRPIILNSAGGVMDGMHRVAKAWMEGREFVRAVQFQVDPEPDEVR